MSQRKREAACSGKTPSTEPTGASCLLLFTKRGRVCRHSQECSRWGTLGTACFLEAGLFHKDKEREATQCKVRRHLLPKHDRCYYAIGGIGYGWDYTQSGWTKTSFLITYIFLPKNLLLKHKLHIALLCLRENMSKKNRGTSLTAQTRTLR